MTTSLTKGIIFIVKCQLESTPNKEPNMITRRTTKVLTAWLPVLPAIFCVLLEAGSARASSTNFLVNGDFNSPGSGSAPTGWTTWTAGGSGYANYEVLTSSVLIDGNDGTVHPNNTGNYDGTYQMTLGATAADGSGGGVYQIVGGAPDIPYTLSVDAGAQGWWLPTGQIRLFFLNSSGVGLATNVVDTTDSLHNSLNGGQGDLYDIGVPYQEWTNSAVSPAGTTQVKVELAGYGGGSCWFDNAVLTAPVVPPVIANLYPDGAVLLQHTNTLSFNASSAAAITNIDVILNGRDVSASLAVTGSPTSETVSYAGLQANKVYTAAVTVTDNSGSSSFKNFTFDTYAPIFSWEAEDYDYDSGQFINSPILSSTAMAGSYFGVTGTEGIDFHDYSDDGPESFRPDPMSTAVSGDVPRQNFIDASVSDYIVGYFDGAGFPSGGNVGLDSYDSQEWVNYTRTFPAGTYSICARIANGNGGTAVVPVSEVTLGHGTYTQTTSALGVFNFPANGWNAYNYVPMTDRFGNVVPVSLSGTTTLRVSAGSGANLNFFMLLPADTNTPAITGVYPDGSTLVQGTNKLTFTVSSASHSIPQANVAVTLNGVTDNNLAFTGSASSWNVSTPLALNVTNYTAVITVTDDAGNTHSTTVYFDTFNLASYDIEAEDWDFSGGQYIDNPVITSVAAADSYFDQSGEYGVDENPGDVLTPPTADYHFRPNDYIATSLCTDIPTQALLAAQLTNSLAFNYNVGWWSTNGWLNYTHNYPAGNYNVYGRLAGDAGATHMIELDMVSPSNIYLGTFTGVGRGFNLFDWIPLRNTNNGQLATVTLGGLATLRTTSLTGNVNPNSYLLVPEAAAEPLLWSYSAGVLTLNWSNPAFHLQTQTNAPGGESRLNGLTIPAGEPAR